MPTLSTRLVRLNSQLPEPLGPLSARNAVLGSTTPRRPVLSDKMAIAFAKQLVQVCVSYAPCSWYPPLSGEEPSDYSPTAAAEFLKLFSPFEEFCSDPGSSDSRSSPVR